jgi:hypothetical protein
MAFAASAAYQASALSLVFTGILWTGSVAWAGVGCFINGRSCGRVHCTIDGVLLPLLSIAGALNVLSIVSFSWGLFWTAFLAILVLSFVPEFIWKKYTRPGQ